MVEHTTTTRLAIGAFYAAPRLDAAISDLLGNGLTLREICLAGTAQAFRNIVHQPPGYVFDERSSLLRSRPLEPLTRAADLELLATSGTVHRTLLQEAQRGSMQQQMSGLSWLFGNADGLPAHLRRHAIAVLVNAPSPELQHRGSRILLRHSEHTVETHEFTTPVRQ